jgi:transcriptional regulator with XRE-family HTH domain
MYGNYLKQLRKQAGLTQGIVADRLGVARSTYVAMESGKGELNLSEIKILSLLYQIAPGDIVEGKIDKENINESDLYEEDTHGTTGLVPYEAIDATFQDSELDVLPREIDPRVDPQKLRNVLLYVLGRIGARPNVGETVLYKLLYFIDFDYYEINGRSITGLTYVKNHYGPTPAREFRSVVNSMIKAGQMEIAETEYFSHTQRKYLPTIEPDLSCLSAQEIKHIDFELERMGEKSAKQLSELSHLDSPWIAAKPKMPINYQLSKYRTMHTSVRELDDAL